MTEPRYPDCEVQFTGTDGNAFAILGRMQQELRRYLRSWPGLIPDGRTVDEEVAAFMDEATSGDYDHLLQTCMRWCSIT